MTTYNTGNPVGPNGSAAAEDLYDNSENLDFWVLTQEEWQWPDRLGVSRWTWYGMEQQFLQNEASREERFNELLANSGYQFIGDYAPTAGIEVTEYNQVLRDSSGALWRLNTTTPIPYTTDGSGMDENGAFVAIDQEQGLRTDLADPVQGGQLVHVRTATGVNQTLEGALSNRASVWGFINGLRGVTSYVNNGARGVISFGARSGNFVWQAGDMSAQVAGDPLEGIFVAPSFDPSGASGAWERTDRILTPEMWGAIGDGVADDSGPLAAFFTSGRGGRGTPGAVYNYSEALEIQGAGADYELNGCTFRYTGPDLGTTYTMRVAFSAGVNIDDITIVIPSGVVVRRVLEVIAASAVIGTIDVESEDQQNNRGATSDAAVAVTNQFIRIDRLRVANFDNGVRWTGNQCWLRELIIENYVRGIWIQFVTDLSFDTFMMSGQSPAASMTPGHNGVLFDDASDITGREIRVEDSGEHGVRFSGNSTGSNRVNIDNIITRNTGGTGVKFRCNAAYTNDDINIGKITCEDCGDDANPITNQEGLLLERVRRLWIGHYSVRRRNKTTSCHNAIVFTDAQVVQIDSVRIENCNREAVYFTTVDQDDGGNTIYRDCNDIQIGGGLVMNPGRHVIFADMDTGDLRNINIDLDIRSIAEGNAALIAFSANAGVFATPSNFNLTWSTAGSPTAGAVRGSGINANVVLDAIGDNFNATAATPKPGSTWLNMANGNRLIRNPAGDWVSLI